ncbi:MAG: hypothetical protein R2750_06255 [Bacteroidales bacterium]
MNYLHYPTKWMDWNHSFRKKHQYHYGKHHQAYVNNLNNLVPDTEFRSASLEDIIKKATGGIFNNGAQVWNHTFYWECLSLNGGGDPKGTMQMLLLKVLLVC